MLGPLGRRAALRRTDFAVGAGAVDHVAGLGLGQRGLLRAIAAAGLGAIGALGAGHELLLVGRRLRAMDAAGAWYRLAAGRAL